MKEKMLENKELKLAMPRIASGLDGGNWEKIRDTLKMIGAPTTSEELGVTKKKIIEALVKAHEIRPERYTILGETGLTKDAAKKVAKITGVI